MSSLIDDAPEGVNTPEFSVSELSGAVKRMVEGEFGFVRVRGEVGRVSRPRSGHVYMDLKDDRAVLAGVIWKGVANGLAVQPEEGMEVVATGRLTTFPGQSKYQIVVESLAPAGVGALMAMLEKRRKALVAEGLFDEARKRPLPYLPRRIGVVTSPSGAVIRDILHRLGERFPVHVLVWPVAVQGEKCAPEVAAAINSFSALPEDRRPDVVIVARGGGSVEDLWGFNEEIVVRAAASSAIPLISAVGHETDTTLIDYAADRRAPTPTAAAEMAVPVRADLIAAIADLQARRLRAMAQGVERRRQRLSDLARALPRPAQLLAERRQRLDLAAASLPKPALMLADRKQRLENLSLRMPKPAQCLADARRDLGARADRLGPALRIHAQKARQRLTETAAGLRPAPLVERIALRKERLQRNAERLRPAKTRMQSQARDKLAGLARTLGVFSYERTLERGYAVVRDSKGSVISTASALPEDGQVEIQFQGDVRVPARTGGGAPSTSPQAPGKPKRKRANPSPDDNQGSLF
ncbi:MAG: exodeoxyribonuclease VII large subunit [Pseudomonadota bacterium]